MTKNGKPDGIWNETDLVIIDFGISKQNDYGNAVCSGTPGFASPEQLIGESHRKSDNYSFGKLMVFIFCEWQTAWNVLYESDTPKIKFNDQFSIIVRSLLQVCFKNNTR